MTKPLSLPLPPHTPLLHLSLRDSGGFMQLLVQNQPSDGEMLRLLCSKQLKKVATKNPRQEEVS